MSGFTRSMVKQSGQVREQRARPPFVAVDTAPTLDAPKLASGIISGTPTAARTYTMDTAANLLAASSFADMDVGDAFEFVIANQTTVTQVITVAVAAGITNAGGASNLLVQPATSRRFLLTKTSATAMTLLGL